MKSELCPYYGQNCNKNKTKATVKHSSITNSLVNIEGFFLSTFAILVCASDFATGFVAYSTSFNRASDQDFRDSTSLRPWKHDTRINRRQLLAQNHLIDSASDLLSNTEEIPRIFDWVLHPVASAITSVRSGTHLIEGADSKSITSSALYTLSTFLDVGIDPVMGILGNIISKAQKYGENVLGATFALALIQAAVVLHQYRNNPRGGLIIPPGLTWGVEFPSEKRKDYMDLIKKVAEERKVTYEGIKTRGSYLMDRMQAVLQQTIEEQKNLEMGDIIDGGQCEKTENNVESRSLEKIKQAPKKVKEGWKRVNQYMVILLPWLANQMSFLMSRYGHLMHLGVIFGLTSLLEFRSSHIPSLLGAESDVIGGEDDYNSLAGDAVPNKNVQLIPEQKAVSFSDPSIPCKIVVIGDSLACGIGTIDRFDENKNKTNPIGLIQNTRPENSTDDTFLKLRLSGSKSDSSANNVEDAIHHLKLSNDKGNSISKSPHSLKADHSISDCWGPAFPRILAATLSQRMGRPVQWRSAGVDGGDVPQIREYCLNVIKEEVESGHAPDLVVILCGSNDLKTIIGSPAKTLFAPGGPAGSFRDNLVELLQDILKLSPKSKIVLPALPTHRLDQSSMLNVFPLTFFLDGFLGFWDLQKKKVADSSPSNVIYCGLSSDHVAAWYKMPPDAYMDDACPINCGTDQYYDEDAISLISADGVHPNRRCYSLWASYVGNTVADVLMLKLIKDLPATVNMRRNEKQKMPSTIESAYR